MAKRLSDRADFKEAIILNSQYTSISGENSECEFGVRWLKSKTEIWQWNDEWGSEVFTTLDKNASRNEIIDAVVDDERYFSSVDLNMISVYGDKPPLGELLCLLWADDESQRRALKLMNRLSDNTLIRIAAANKGALLSDKVLNSFFNVWKYLDENDADIDELSVEIELKDVTSSGILEAFKEELIEINKKNNEKDQAREVKLRPFIDDIRRINAQWIAEQPPSPSNLSRYPRPYIPNLLDYLEFYVLREGMLPSGIHAIPSQMVFVAEISSKVMVDFDQFQKSSN